MQNHDLSHTLSPGNNWLLLGELELPATASKDADIQAWLLDILSRFALDADFLNKVLWSAQDAVAHVPQAGAVPKSDHIHLKIFVPQNSTSKKQTWGFFRIEKGDDFAQSVNNSDHSIELYLYQEG